MRKYNDVYKLLPDVAEDEEAKSEQEQESRIRSILIKETLNKVLQHVLKIFYRLSQAKESETDCFSIEKYQELVYNLLIFDVAKLYDIVAIYGRSNPQVVRQLI